MDNDQTRLLYSPNSAAYALNISRSRLYELLKAGEIRFVLIGADRRIPADEIERVASKGLPRQVA